MTTRGSLEVVGHRVAPGAAPRNDFTYSIIEPAPITARAGAARPSGAGEKRGDPRRRTHLRDGVLAERHGRALVDCQIRDRSRLGARLRLDENRPLPRHFLLTDAACRTRYRATLVWQVGRDAGVRLQPADKG